MWVKFGLSLTVLHLLDQPLLYWHRLSCSRGICCGRVRVMCMHGSVAPFLAQLHAEKADISGGSVIKRILFLASHCRRGWGSGALWGSRWRGRSREEGENVHIYPDIRIKPARINLWLNWSETLVVSFLRILLSWGDNFPDRRLCLACSHTFDIIDFFKWQTSIFLNSAIADSCTDILSL